MTLIFAASALSGLALAQTASPPAVPPPVEQASADCARPVYASDMLVCEDSGLRAQDQKLAALIAATPLTADSPLIESDTAWFSRSRRCAFSADHRACLVAAYSERLAVRAVLAEAPAAPGEALLCRAGDSSKGMTLTPAPDSAAMVLRSRSSGEIHAVIFDPTAEDAPWQPFASYVSNSRRVSIRTLAGVRWSCRK